MRDTSSRITHASQHPLAGTALTLAPTPEEQSATLCPTSKRHPGWPQTPCTLRDPQSRHPSQVVGVEVGRSTRRTQCSAKHAAGSLEQQVTRPQMPKAGAPSLAYDPAKRVCSGRVYCHHRGPSISFQRRSQSSSNGRTCSTDDKGTPQTPKQSYASLSRPPSRCACPGGSTAAARRNTSMSCFKRSPCSRA